MATKMKNLPRLLTIIGVAALGASGCGGDSAGPGDPVMEVVVITDQEHHLGDNAGAEGVQYDAQFTLAVAVDSAFVSVTFLDPNSFGQSGPEIENPPKISVNTVEVGLDPTDFPNNPSCVSGTGPGREYSCDLTVVLPASTEVLVGVNSIRVASEAATGGDDDFVFTDLLVTTWR